MAVQRIFQSLAQGVFVVRLHKEHRAQVRSFRSDAAVARCEN
jgi:hypothetical protein